MKRSTKKNIFDFIELFCIVFTVYYLLSFGSVDIIIKTLISVAVSITYPMIKELILEFK